MFCWEAVFVKDAPRTALEPPSKISAALKMKGPKGSALQWFREGREPKAYLQGLTDQHFCYKYKHIFQLKKHVEFTCFALQDRRTQHGLSLAFCHRDPESLTGHHSHSADHA